MPNPTKRTSRAEVDELMGALGLPVEPFDPLHELDRMADRLGILTALSKVMSENVAEMLEDLAEIREALEEAGAGR